MDRHHWTSKDVIGAVQALLFTAFLTALFAVAIWGFWALVYAMEPKASTKNTGSPVVGTARV